MTTTVEQGLGALQTAKGNLPLQSIEAAVSITGLVGRVALTQGFHNPHDVPLEATYIFPLPDRAAVTAMRMTADGRVIEAELKERGQAREEYDQAIAQGRRASIAEEERPDVFTMRVGNILPGEQVSVALTVVGPLSYEDGEATFRLPLVVAPRYIPGTPVDGVGVGDGHAPDTDAVPDASRITPPVLLPGFPHPVRLAIEVDIDPAGFPLGPVTSSLHAVTSEGNHLSIRPGERADRDFILRLGYGQPDAATPAFTLTPDADGGEGTFRLTVLPPTTALPPRPRDVVLLLDRSGSMGGWKMVAARRAAARIVDTLTAADRFAVLTFDHNVERPPSMPDALVPATDRNRYRAVEHLSRVDARGGTELLAPLLKALELLNRANDSTEASATNETSATKEEGATNEGSVTNETSATKDGGNKEGVVAGDRQRALVLVTDGQVGNEDQILVRSADGLAGIRVHTVGIDRAVNAGFLGRLAAAGGGRCELVESEDRLDEAMDSIHRRIGAPVVTGLTLTTSDLSIVDGTVTPARLPDLYPGVPLVLTGRYNSQQAPGAVLTGRARDGSPWTIRAAGVTVNDDALTATWARAHLRDLEDKFVTAGNSELEQRITATSLRFRVLCRFTAWLAVDTRIATDGAPVHHVIQPVEPVSGWEDVVARGAGTMSTLAGMALAPASYAAPGADGPVRMASFRARSAGWAPADGRGPSPAPAGGPTQAGAPVGGVAHRSGAEAEDDLLRLIRTQAAVEAQRLRAEQGAPEYERRELLADLGTRLAAVIGSAPVRPGLEPVRALLADLEDDRPLGVPAEAFEQLWTRTLRVLDDLARSAGSGPTVTGPPVAGPPSNPSGSKPPGSKPFWKRGPA